MGAAAYGISTHSWRLVGTERTLTVEEVQVHQADLAVERQGASSKDIGYTEVSVGRNRLA